MPRAMTFVRLVFAAVMTGAVVSPALASDQQQPQPSTTLEAQAVTLARAERPDTVSSDATAASVPEGQPPAGPPIPAPVPMAVSSGGEIGVYSTYMWRGFVLADAASMQPTYWVKFADSVTVSSWMNVAGHQLQGPLTEHDLTVDYTKALNSKFTMSAGWINYVFPGLDSGSVTNEIYGGLAHSSYFNPAVKVFVDVHEGKGTYFNLSASHTYAIGGAGLTATPGYNDRQWIDESTWSDANFGVKLTVPTPFKRVFLTPALYYSKALDKDLGVFDDHFYGGVGIMTKLF